MTDQIKTELAKLVKGGIPNPIVFNANGIDYRTFDVTSVESFKRIMAVLKPSSPFRMILRSNPSRNEFVIRYQSGKEEIWVTGPAEMIRGWIDPNKRQASAHESVYYNDNRVSEKLVDCFDFKGEQTVMGSSDRLLVDVDEIEKIACFLNLPVAEQTKINIPSEITIGCKHYERLLDCESACRLLIEAYDYGEANQGSMDWSHVDDAYEWAKDAMDLKKWGEA